MKLLLMFFLILKCNSISLNTVSKQIVIPGVINGITIIKYNAIFTVKREATIQKIQFQNEGEDLKYGLFNIDTGKILKANTLLKKGNYALEIILPYSFEQEKRKDTLQFTFSVKNKQYKIAKEVTTKTRLHMR